ncbi:hypothetical protein EJ06DRAFT_531804 [Trichodelitschia bisporula]|uniref:Uncharacterized protein n=1 Tax=Trichodelitschia bisporula TaxID=703511 RepID=A0A6G1HS90_9PEZI|nr:hypothetical protein EJ06DRAFT_531804 [Trichodelitschia bisporula]
MAMLQWRIAIEPHRLLLSTLLTSLRSGTTDFMAGAGYCSIFPDILQKFLLFPHPLLATYGKTAPQAWWILTAEPKSNRFIQSGTSLLISVSGYCLLVLYSNTSCSFVQL